MFPLLFWKNVIPIPVPETLFRIPLQQIFARSSTFNLFRTACLGLSTSRQFLQFEVYCHFGVSKQPGQYRLFVTYLLHPALSPYDVSPHMPRTTHPPTPPTISVSAANILFHRQPNCRMPSLFSFYNAYLTPPPYLT